MSSGVAKQDVVSIIGGSYLHPIARLFEALTSLSLGPVAEGATVLENGYSVAILTLSVLFAESYLRRACYVRGDPAYRSALSYARREFSDYSRLDCLEEIFVARDIVAHNHLWGSLVEWDDDGNMHTSDTKHLAGGDPKFERVANTATLRTRRLDLRLVPTSVCHVDAAVVFAEAARFVIHLESIDRRYAYLSEQILKYRGKALRFPEFLSQLMKEMSGNPEPSN